MAGETKNNRRIILMFTLTCLLFFGVSFFAKEVYGYGYGYGYGYDCGNNYGYGYSCTPPPAEPPTGPIVEEEKSGVNYGRLKNYKNKMSGRRDVFRSAYNKVKLLRKSKNPALHNQFLAMQKTYFAHKFDKKEQFEKLSPKIQETYRTYRKYHVYKQYRKYKELVD